VLNQPFFTLWPGNSTRNRDFAPSDKRPQIRHCLFPIPLCLNVSVGRYIVIYINIAHRTLDYLLRFGTGNSLTQKPERNDGGYNFSEWPLRSLITYQYCVVISGVRWWKSHLVAWILHGPNCGAGLPTSFTLPQCNSYLKYISNDRT
jgi:hypothetical protein